MSRTLEKSKKQELWRMQVESSVRTEPHNLASFLGCACGAYAEQMSLNSYCGSQHFNQKGSSDGT